jgi:mono/diheme cytochrome c family protein
MTEHEPETSHTEADGTWHWLLGGLVGGLAVLGLLIAAYAVGYHRGQDKVAAPAPVVTSTAPTTTASTTTPTTTAAAPAPAGPVPVTPALVSQGKQLFTSDGCAGCHSLTGAAGAGPTFKGLAGSSVSLTTGASVQADDAYLTMSIADPDADIVKGYSAGIMPPAIASFQLATKPDEVRALVAFIKSQK